MTTDTLTETVEHLDFPVELPCSVIHIDQTRCTNPAKWNCLLMCPTCAAQSYSLICNDHMRDIHTKIIYCTLCRTVLVLLETVPV